MKRSSEGRATGKPTALPTGTGGPRPQGSRRLDLRIDATPEQLAAVIGARPPKAAHEWNYLKRKPVQSDSEAQPQRPSKPSVAKAG